MSLVRHSIEPGDLAAPIGGSYGAWIRIRQREMGTGRMPALRSQDVAAEYGGRWLLSEPDCRS